MFNDSDRMAFSKPEIRQVESEDCDCDKGILVCSNCSEPIDPETMMFCHECGKRISD